MSQFSGKEGPGMQVPQLAAPYFHRETQASATCGVATGQLEALSSLLRS